MSPSAVALLVALFAAVGAIGAALITSRNSMRETAQSAVTKTLDEVWKQRVTFRDEQIESLRSELGELRAESEAASAALTKEIQRLSALVISLGGSPHDK